MRDTPGPVMVVTLLSGLGNVRLQGGREKLGDRDMKFVTWHSSDGKPGEDECCSLS